MNSLSTTETEQLFRQALAEESAPLRQAALNQLRGTELTPPAAQEIAQLLGEYNAFARRRAAALLGVVTLDDAVNQLLANALLDPSWVVRESVVDAIGQHIQKQSKVTDLVQKLVDCSLGDRNRVVREAALKMLEAAVSYFSEDESQKLVNCYIESAQNSRFNIRRRAVAGLTALHRYSPDALPCLVRCADDSHHKVRASVLEHAARLGESGVALLPVLVKRWFDDSESLQERTSNCLLQLTHHLDDLTVHSVSLLMLGHDPTDRLATLLRSPGIVQELSVELKQLAQRRMDWAERIKPIPPHLRAIPSRDLVSQVQHVIEAVVALSRHKAATRRRKETLWFVSKLFQLLLERVK